MFHRSLAILLSLIGASTPAEASRHLSDTWWKPDESGWALVLEQHEHVATAMIYAYDDEGRGRWYFAALTPTHLTGDGLPILEGTLNQTDGPPAGTPYDPGQVDVEPVGELHIEPLSIRALSATYRVGDVTRQVTLQRFSPAMPELPGAYQAMAVLRGNGGGAPVELVIEQYPLVVDVVDGVFGMVADDGAGTACNYTGDVQVDGRLTAVTGSYGCADGTSGTFLLDELVATPHGFTGTLRRRHGARTWLGTVSWLRP